MIKQNKTNKYMTHLNPRSRDKTANVIAEDNTTQKLKFLKINMEMIDIFYEKIKH